MSARFVTLEGGEGVGKSTQLKALAAALRARGLEIVETREPGGSPGAESIRVLLLEGAVDRWTAETEALLFAAARADHVARTIRPALADGKWVLCDRYIDSSIVYQGMVGAVGEPAIRALHEVGSHNFLPDRTLLLRIDDEEAAERAGRRDAGAADRFGARGADYHARVNAAFDALAAREPGRYRTIDAVGSAETVTEALLAALGDLL